MSSKDVDIDTYNEEVDRHNEMVDVGPVPEPTFSKKGCGILFAKTINLFIVLFFALIGLAWLQNTVTTPATATPESAWTPVVNPMTIPSGGYVPAMYRATFSNGDHCYVTVGILVDQVSCVSGAE